MIDKKPEFVKPSKAEVNKIIKAKKKGIQQPQYVDPQAREKIDVAYELHFNYLQLKLVETEIKLKQEQIANFEGKESITELYNGCPKPKNMVVAEHNLKLYQYKRLASEIEANKRFLKASKLKDKEIKDIMWGDYDFTKLKG
jgi:hypothetical protein